MNKLLWKSAGIFLLSFLCTFSAWGVPAKPGLIVYKQPDGTELKVRLIGDEFHHYYLSEDGLLLLGDATNYLCYASVNNGQITPSAIKATDISLRPIAANHLLASQDNKEILKKYTSRAEKESSMLRKSASQMNKSNAYPTTGKQKVLVILAEFADESFITPNAKECFNRMLNEKGYKENGATGSARDYYMASSNGQYEPDINVFGPIRLPKKMAYYGANHPISGNDMNPAQMIADACKLLDNEIDFSAYDLDKDGYVDNVYVFYAGYGEADGGDANTVWPHQFFVYKGAGIRELLDGVYIDRYACSNEILMTTKQMTGIGTFCHEFGHVLGLPDLYDTAYQTIPKVDPACWDIMASGSYLNEGNTPPMMSAYERFFLNWVKPLEINQVDTTFVLPPLAENKVYKISTANPNEYFLFENRQQKEWDSYLPGHGMIVWHIDYDEAIWFENRPNNNGSHQHIDIEEADGIASDTNYEGDPFPGAANITSITDHTSPNLKAWNGTGSNLGIYNIHETADSLILFDVIDPTGTLDITIAKEATEITPVSFRANWEKVKDATSYVIDVYYQTLAIGTAAMVYADGYLARPVGNVTSFEVTGLDPEKTYYYKVRARGSKYIGGYSSPQKVRTANKDYRFFAPAIAAPTQITDHSFVANWNNLETTKTYYVSAFKVAQGEMIEEKADFKKGAAVPEGWKSTSYSVSSKEGYYGEAPNSLGLSRNKSYVSSSINEGILVGSVSFWYRGTNDLDEGSKLEVYGYVQNEWKLINSISPVTKADGGAIFSMKLDQFKEMYSAIKVEHNRPGIGTIYIDDIRVNYFKPVLTTIPEYENKAVENALSLEVTGLNPFTFYAYQVKGTNGTLESLNSDMYFLKTLSKEEASISNTESLNQIYAYVAGTELIVKGVKTGIPVAVYDISGRLICYKTATDSDIQIQLPTDGIYVIRIEEKTLKVIR